jgi:hypothetical protein
LAGKRSHAPGEAEHGENPPLTAASTNGISVVSIAYHSDGLSRDVLGQPYGSIGHEGLQNANFQRLALPIPAVPYFPLEGAPT